MVYSALAAVETVREDPPDLVVVDLTMHDIEGFFTLEGLRHDESAPQVPILTTSPINPSPDESRELRHGRDDLVRGGLLSEDEFFTSVKSVLDNLDAQPLP
jgi:CheY-like chemotaxis protein